MTLRLALLFLLLAIAPARAAMEDGLAITDPQILQKLEHYDAAAPMAHTYSIADLLFPSENRTPGPVSNDNLFKGPLKTIAETLINDINTLPQKSLDSDARKAFANGGNRQLRFSAWLLTHPESGFVLTGIVNRMDRAYRTVDGLRKIRTCGEVRFLYRFTYDVTINGGMKVASRLPFTVSVVLNARGEDDRITCAEIARRWEVLHRPMTPDALLAYLRGRDGPLDYIRPSQVDRVEVNLQLFRLPASMKNDFGGDAEYLMRVFRRTAPGQPFLPTRIENQIDRAKLASDPALREKFKKFLFSDAALADLDRGVLDIPFPYLADVAVSVSPGGAARSENAVFLGLASDEEILGALEDYVASGKTLDTIKSPEGFRLRVDELSCTGCHQTRAIAGFHFPGADLPGEPASNAVAVPASAHFFGDLPRRQAVVDAFAAGKVPDFSRGFSARPDRKWQAALSGTELFDGWGASCYVGDDPSFTDWTCRPGLACKILHGARSSPGMGTCVTAGQPRIGDPLEFGVVETKAYGDDSFRRTSPAGSTDPANYVLPRAPTDRSDYVVAHQGYRAATKTGGFPAGMLRTRVANASACRKLPKEAACGRVAATGFNDCIADGKPFRECLKLTRLAGLRACDREHPCRGDYICTAPYPDLRDARNMGTCIPPYFMFQFRVDGHPNAFTVGDAPY